MPHDTANRFDTAKHFDAPRPPSLFAASGRLVAARWGAVVALVVLTTGAFVAAAGILALVALGRAGGDAALRATGAAVVLEPQTSAADAEAVGALLRSIPGVAGATFRPRDDALKDLVGRGLPAPDARNPLPDVWVLRVRAGEPGSPPGARLSAAAQAAATLPHVSAVRFDPRWAERLDRDDAARRDLVEPLLAGALAAVGVGLLCAALLGGGALRERQQATRKSVLALVSCCVAATAALLAFACLAAAPTIENRMRHRSVEDTSAPLTAALSSAERLPQLGTLWACGVALLGLGLVAGGVVGDSRRE